jgi:S1-C subfamily serine protease
MRFRRHAIIVVIGIAGLLGSCEQKGVTPAANASESRSPAPAAPAPALGTPAAVTPRTESPDVAKNLSKAFAATAKAVGASVVRINVRAGPPPLAERGGGSGNEPFADALPPAFRRFFFDFGNAQPDFPGPGMPGPVAGTGSGIVIDGAGNVVTNSHVVDGSTEINSGGPLVNLDGDVVGLNTLIRTGAGGAYGFAVPINEVRRVAQALIKDGRVRYPFLGVSVRDLGTLDEAAKEKLERGAPAEGAYVAEVTPGSPAASAGIRQGDVITKLDAESIKTSSDVVDYVSSRNIGAAVAVTVFRDGNSRELRATLASAPGDVDERNEAPKLGLCLQTLTPEIASSLGLPIGARGVAITDGGWRQPRGASGAGPGRRHHRRRSPSGVTIGRTG